MAGTPIAQIVDDLLSAPKVLAGNPDWHEVGHRGEHRLVMPIQIDGQGTNVDFEVNAYPNIRDLRFRIMLRMPQCIWRVDYVDDEPHVNPFDSWSECGESFCEPHYHSWADNRRFATHAKLPEPLPVARILAGFRGFEATFRWFCGETNIGQPRSGVVDLPQRNRLV